MRTKNPYDETVKSDDNTSTAFGNKFVRWLFNNWQYIVSFLIPSLILMAAYFSFGVYPFGENSVLALDLNAQYVYYFDYMYDVFLGNESIFYSWSRNLSGEFLGIAGYYLLSPFNLIVWLFPRAHITEGLLAMLLTKVGFIGLTASIFFKRGREYSKSTSVIFSSLYALSSYVLVQTMNPMWLDGVLILPLVVLGIETLVRKGRIRLLIVSLAYAFITSFYIGFMIGIFTAVYYFFYLFMSNAYGRLKAGQLFGRGALLALSAITSVCLSSFILIPVLNSLSLGKLDFSVPDYTIVENFTLFNLFGKLLPNSYDTVRMEGLPFIYCGVITLLMVFCYFFAEKINIRKRIAAAFLILLMAAFMYIRPLDMVWHGGQMPNWLPYRYSFILSFILLVLGAEAFENMSSIPRKRIGIGGLFFFLLTIFMGTMDTYNVELDRELLPEFPNLAIAALIIAVFTALLLQFKDKGGAKKMWAFTVATFVIAELSYNTVTALYSQDTDIVYSDRKTYVDSMIPLREKVREIRDSDNGFYRMEKNFNRSANDPIAVRMYGATHSSSTLNAKPIELLRNFGFTSRAHYTKYLGATPMMDDLFGFKYILSCPDEEYSRITGVGDITVEENTDAMPILYLTDPGLKDYRFLDYPTDTDNVFNTQSRFMTKILGDEDLSSYIKVIPRMDLFLETENVVEGHADSHTVYTVSKKGQNAHLKYTFNAPEDGEIFLWMPSKYEYKLNVWVNHDHWKGNYYETENYNAKSIGFFNKGEEVILTLTLTEDRVYFKDLMLGYFDNEVYEKDYARLREMNKDTIVNKISSTHITALTNYPGERLLLTTIPAEPGWEVKVDGYKAQAVVILDSLMGVMLSPGVHSVDFVYRVPYGFWALAITGLGAVLFIGICITGTLIRRRFGEVDYGKDNLDYLADGYDIKNPEQQIEDILAELNLINDNEEDTGNSEYQKNEPVFSDNTDEPIISSNTDDSIILDNTDEPVISSNTDDSIILDNTDEPVISSNTDDSIILDNTDEPVISSNTDDSIILDNTDEPIISSNTDDSIILDNTDEPIISSNTDDSIILDNTDEPVISSNTDDSIILDNTDEPVISEKETEIESKTDLRNTASIPYKEVIKPAQKSNDFYAESAEDLFPQKEVDRLSVKKDGASTENP